MQQQPAVTDDEIRRAVCLMEAQPVDALWHDLKALVAQNAGVRPTAPAYRHPMHASMVEVLQRALVTLEVHDELARCGVLGADGLAPHEVQHVWQAARHAGQVTRASQVPGAVARLLVALKPVLLGV